MKKYLPYILVSFFTVFFLVVIVIVVDMLYTVFPMQVPNIFEKENINYKVNVTSVVSEAIEDSTENVVLVYNYNDDKLIGTGSGVIYKLTNDSAYIVTNNHVVDGGTSVEIETTTGYKRMGIVVGKDAVTDLAVVKIPKGSIDHYMEFSDSSALKTGEYVIAIGNPLGLSSSATLGIISSKERLVPVDTDGDGHDDFYASVLQTDAAINPGNSGGALINLAGKLIGINSMKIAETHVEGIGFSIPSNLVMRIISELEVNGVVNRPTRLLGIIIQMIDNNGVFANQIIDVNNNSWAEQIGLQVDDIIIKINGNNIVNIFDLKYYLTNTPEGETLTLTIERDNDIIEKVITIPAD